MRPKFGPSPLLMTEPPINLSEVSQKRISRVPSRLRVRYTCNGRGRVCGPLALFFAAFREGLLKSTRSSARMRPSGSESGARAPFLALDGAVSVE
jgi:hypothetical protein